MYSLLGLVIFVAVEGTFVCFTKGHDHFISNSIRCGCLRTDQCNIACRLLASLLALFSIMFLETFVFKEVVRYAAHRVWYSFASVVHDSPYW